MKLWRQFNEWKEWRGISWRDLVYSLFALGTLVGFIAILTLSIV